jgi:membrane protein DedA with SNARE-associated domain
MSSIITGLIEYIVNLVIYVIRVSNYPGIFFLMFLEGLLLPIPSEVVMAFAGYLSLTGQLPNYFGIPAVILAVLAGSVGNAVGATAAYAIGYYGGRPAILKFGKYVKLDQNSLDKTEQWFNKYGEVSVFFTRLVPVFRTFISIPAGLAEMNFKKFIILTFGGTLIWDSVLIYLGFVLGSKWEAILGAFNDYSYLAIAAAIIVLIYVYRKLSVRASNGKVNKQRS